MRKQCAILVLSAVLASASFAYGTNDPFEGATDIGGGWKYSTWFGCFWPATPWVYSVDHGWVYPSGTPSSMLIWDTKGGWWWVRNTSYPFLYSFSQQSWLWYMKGSVNPRWFYNYSTGQWEDDQTPRVCVHFYRSG